MARKTRESVKMTEGKKTLLQHCYRSIKPVQGKVLKAEAFIPIISNETEQSYDLVAIHRIIGGMESETLDYIENQLSWDGERFISVRMLASIPGIELIAKK